jgi:biopolymer transport protein ExbD
MIKGPTKKAVISFDMTAIIDIVFLLIIFFMLVCQFIAAENFELDVPAGISAAKQMQSQDQPTTVTVMFSSGGNIAYAVGSKTISGDIRPKLLNREHDNSEVNAVKPKLDELIKTEVNSQLSSLKSDRKVVTLRCDKDIEFGQLKSALAGITQSSATNIRLAVIQHPPAD